MLSTTNVNWFSENMVLMLMEKSIMTVPSTRHLFSLQSVHVFREKLQCGNRQAHNASEGCAPMLNLISNHRQCYSCVHVPNNHASCHTHCASISRTHLDKTSLSKSYRGGQLRRNSTSMNSEHILKKKKKKKG